MFWPLATVFWPLATVVLASSACEFGFQCRGPCIECPRRPAGFFALYDPFSSLSRFCLGNSVQFINPCYCFSGCFPEFSIFWRGSTLQHSKVNKHELLERRADSNVYPEHPVSQAWRTGIHWIPRHAQEFILFRVYPHTESQRRQNLFTFVLLPTTGSVSRHFLRINSLINQYASRLI